MIGSPQTLPQFIRRNAAADPNGLAQRHKQRGVWHVYSWTEVQDRIHAIAAGLMARGIQRGETVLIISENRPEQYWAEYAALCVGAKVVSLYPDATADEMAYIARDSEAVCIFAEDQEQVDKALVLMADNPAVRLVVYWEDGGLWSYRNEVLADLRDVTADGRALIARDAACIVREVERGTADDIALLTYTSGTTGKPKGVIITYRVMFDAAERIQVALDLKPGMEYLSYIPLAWMTEQWIGVALGVMLPMRVNFAERPDQITDAIRELAVEVLLFGPRQWESIAALVHARMLDAPPWRRRVVDWALEVGKRAADERLRGRAPAVLDRLLHPLADAIVLRPLRDQLGFKRNRVAMTGGAAAAPDVFRLFAGLGVQLRSVYGSSEYGAVAAHSGATYHPETIGSPIRAATQWGSALETRIGESGELLLQGGPGFAGYWNLPEKTAERFDGQWFRTGDAVQVDDASGELTYLDRVDHMSRLKVGMVYPKQFLEVRLRFSPYIRECMVIGDERHDHVTALININYEVVSRWAEQRGLSFTTLADLSQRAEVVELIAGEVRRVNAALPGHGQVRGFANLPKDLDADEGELTRTRKLKREFIEERYASLIQGLYERRAVADLRIPVKYQDGRTGILSSTVRIAVLDSTEAARS
jgi:long-chain acyl-CoA synthetase